MKATDTAGHQQMSTTGARMTDDAADDENDIHDIYGNDENNMHFGADDST